MAGSEIFIASRNLDGLSVARTDGGEVYDDFDEVNGHILETCGADAAALFARPVVSRGAAGGAGIVSWYAARRGTIQPWSELDKDARIRAEADIAALLGQMRPLLAHPDVGESLSRWMNISSPGASIHLVGGRPVLVDWGLLPSGAAGNPGERERLFKAGLGRMLPGLGTPLFLEEDDRPALRPTLQPTPLAAPGAEPAAMVAHPVTQQVVVNMASRSWIGPAIASAVAAVLLIVLLIPGILVFPSGGPVVSSASEAAAAEILRTRIADLQGALNAGICEPGTVPGSIGELVSPDTTQTRIAQAPVSQAPRFAPDTSLPPYGDVTAPTSLAPPPANVQSPPAAPGAGQDASSPTDLVDYLDAATVLVLASSGSQLSTGSGFFVNATDIVTNNHVVEAAGAEFYVASKRLGHPLRATLVARSTSSVPGEADFAVLRTEGATGARALKLANDVPRASNVMAFGFPAFVMESDSEFQCLMSTGADADSDCLPLGSVTMGVVTAIQRGENGSPLILHSATISEGNSGGPLVDYCGRAIGVNTFGRRDVERVQQLNFAQHASGLEAFLTANGITYELETSGCRLVPAASGESTAAAPEPDAQPADAAPEQTAEPGTAPSDAAAPATADVPGDDGTSTVPSLETTPDESAPAASEEAGSTPPAAEAGPADADPPPAADEPTNP